MTRRTAPRIDKTLAGLSSTFAPGALVHNPRGLRRWHAALANARYGAASIVVIGDSITMGVGADDQASGTPDSVGKPRGWVGQLRTLFADRYGDPGDGWLSMPDPGSRVALAGGAISATYGPREQGFRCTSDTQTATISLDACTEFDLWTWDGGSGTFSVAIDGGGADTQSAGSGNINLRTWTKHTWTGLADTTHTVVVTGPSSGGVYIAGVDARRQTTGVRVHRMGKAGDTTNNVLGLDSSNSSNTGAKARSLEGIGLVPAAHLVIVSMGVNDYGRQNETTPESYTQPGTTPPQYEANLQTIADQIVSKGACALLLSQGFSYSTPSPETHLEAEYHAAARAVAQRTDHVAHLSVPDLWGTRAAGDVLGFYCANSVHPSLKGHGSMAQLVYDALVRPYGANASTT